MTKTMWLQGTRLALVLAVAGAALAPATASAQITRVSRSEPRQAVVFNIGYFSLRSLDSRGDDDTLVLGLPPLTAEVGDLSGATFGGEYLFGVSDYLEGGIGVGFHQRSVASIYRNVTYPGGAEIAQDLKLRTAPFTATIRFLPIGRGSVEPYVGGGLALVNWRYSEIGDFVDFSDDSIFPGRYIADGNTLGAVLLGGVRGVVGDVWTVGGELRYLRAEGDTDAVNTGFLGDKIDLGGWSANFTFGIRF